ncbi:Fe-S cluster assembly sulfur transfer protein SufU [Bombilactobacillus bombi]|uniref:Fe-S cluster assembly sulfur transfer protein SufU n=1 Tax=Bombilactobacillus bombi TaxID=1303590 RepID=UPI0015E618D1|nr:SUF system NifU family Fe-S cluster assembly protein [Bombilactobacillus bombi]MBA1434021.1 SUF system NifU family Fe-S cluster assembly protein [Bombilactobacillus bombi]
MIDVRQLYQRIILEHAHHPHHFGILDDYNYQQVLHNPDCGDTIVVFAQINDQILQQVSFKGEGCIISQASASMMTDIVIAQDLAAIHQSISDFQQLIMGKLSASKKLGDAIVFSNLQQFPTRVRCAALAWHALQAIIEEAQHGKV